MDYRRTPQLPPARAPAQRAAGGRGDRQGATAPRLQPHNRLWDSIEGGAITEPPSGRLIIIVLINGAGPSSGAGSSISSLIWSAAWMRRTSKTRIDRLTAAAQGARGALNARGRGRSRAGASAINSRLLIGLTLLERQCVRWKAPRSGTNNGDWTPKKPAGSPSRQFADLPRFGSLLRRQPNLVLNLDGVPNQATGPLDESEFVR